MAFAAKDRVRESSVTTGTGEYTLAGAPVGFQPFSAIGAGNTCPYFATDGVNWEAGIGTILAGPARLQRTIITGSSNGGAAVNWGAGTRDVVCGFNAGLFAIMILQSIALAKGDLIAATAAGAMTREAVGANNSFYAADSSNATGHRWQAAATQAEQEAGTSAVAPVTPGTQKYHPSAAKVWAEFDGTGVPAFRAQYNCSSITDNGTGDYTINFISAMSGTAYSVALTVISAGAGASVRVANIASKSATGVRILIGSIDVNGNLVLGDFDQIHVICFGDQ